MRINFKTIEIGGHTGYGNASRLLVKSLEDRGVLVRPDSHVTLNFCMPPAYEYGEYTIGYTPWESTQVPDSWHDGLRRVDELWTPASWVTEVFAPFRNDEIHVIPHGIDKCWEPHKHRANGPFTFLHVGEPAVRKGGDIVLEAWHRAFRNRKDVKLVYKCIQYPACRVKDRSGSIVASPGMHDNVQVLTNIMTQQEMLSLYNRVDCMVYPSRGEGFGLIPFEAMASGLPTILPQSGMGDFTRFSSLQLQNYRWVASPETRIHPGRWMDHSVDEVIALMERAMARYSDISEDAFEAANSIHGVYSWSSVAEAVEHRLKAVPV